MENTFEEESSQYGDINCFPDLLVEEFYNKMKKSVVLIAITINRRDDAEESEDQGDDDSDLDEIKDECSIQVIGAGFFVDDSGLILTSARVVEKEDTIPFRCFNDKSLCREAKVVMRNNELDLALLKVKGELPADLNFVKFADENSVRVGMTVASISHGRWLPYSFSIGEITFPCNFSEPITDEDWNPRCRICSQMKHDDSLLCPPVHLIETTNMHMEWGGLGYPVFNSSGLVVGMFFSTSAGFDYCVPVTELTKCVENWKSSQRPEGHSN